jgi:type I restriction enzyme S subunit
VLIEGVSGVYLNSFCFGFRLREGASADGLYLAYFFRSAEGRKLLYSLAQGATRHNLSKTALLAVEFHLPKLAEQTAIVEVLTAMDAEVTALKRRRDKTYALKQAMMGELFTGKTRLVSRGGCHA